MSFLNKVQFWKKEDEFDFDKMVDQQIHEPNPEPLGFGEDHMGEEKSPFSSSPGFSPSPLATNPSRPMANMPSSQAPPPPQMSGSNRDLELINSKLDTIKALLASLDQRLATMENPGEKKQKLW